VNCSGRKLQASNAESTGSRGGLYSGGRWEQRMKEGGGHRLLLVFCFFSSHFLIPVTPVLPLLHYFGICISSWSLLGLGLEGIHYNLIS